MISTHVDRRAVCELVVRTAREELLPRFPIGRFAVKPDGSLVTDADRAVERRLRQELAIRWPSVAFLGEEMPATQQRAVLGGGGALWIVDPLDGTSNFVARIPFFGISVALIEGGEPRLGVVYDPVREECFSAQAGAGAWFNEERLAVPAGEWTFARATVLTDLKHLPDAVRRRLLGRTPFGSQRCFGSSALEWCWMALARGQLYLHGGQRLWDHAAGWLILHEAGGHSRTLEGERVFRPVLAPRSVVSSPDADLLSLWHAWLVGGPKR